MLAATLESSKRILKIPNCNLQSRPLNQILWGPVVRTQSIHCPGPEVQSLVREYRSCKLHSVVKKIVYVKSSYKSETTVLKVVSKSPSQIGSLLSKMLLPHLTLRLKIVMISSQVNLM